MRNPSCKWALAMGLAALAVLAAPALVAEEAPAAAKPEAPAGAATAEPVEVELPGVGLTVAIDPVTGRLRQPTPEEARALAAGMMQKLGRKGPAQVVHHRDGMLSAVLTTDYLDYSVATVDADGNLSLTCVAGSESAARELTGSAEEVK